MPAEYILNEDQEKWLTALESGEYKQITGLLFGRGGFCCLGVGCVALGMESVEIDGVGDLGCSIETRMIESRLKLRTRNGGSRGEIAVSLIGLNDDCDFDFKEIAAVIRDDPSVYFHE